MPEIIYVVALPITLCYNRTNIQSGALRGIYTNRFLGCRHLLVFATRVHTPPLTVTLPNLCICRAVHQPVSGFHSFRPTRLSWRVRTRALLHSTILLWQEYKRNGDSANAVPGARTLRIPAVYYIHLVCVYEKGETLSRATCSERRARLCCVPCPNNVMAYVGHLFFGLSEYHPQSEQKTHAPMSARGIFPILFYPTHCPTVRFDPFRSTARHGTARTRNREEERRIS